MKPECTVEILKRPVFFTANRVWRCYQGGALLDKFAGRPHGTDGHFPEEWLASATRADNGEWQQSADEGLSVIREYNQSFQSVISRFSADALADTSGTLGVLCKFLDSAIRLPIQCHPDRDFSRLHYGCEYGKTESWIILDTREINGEKPYILLGFKPGTTPEQFRRAVLAQDIPTMCGYLNKIIPRPGETYFIPGRLPHAIGPGLLILEVQEPTDFVIQPERKIGDVALNERAMWGGLDVNTAFSCFDYTTRSLDQLLTQFRLQAQPAQSYGGAYLESLVGPQHTECFRVDRLTVSSYAEIPCRAPWHLAIVTSGGGIVCAGNTSPIRQGDAMFISSRIRKLAYRSTGNSPMVVYLVSRHSD